MISGLTQYHDDMQHSHTGKVEQDAKSHDTESLGRSKVAMGGAHVLKLARLLVENLDIGRDVSVSPFLGVLIEHLVRNFGNVEFMISFSL